jgi:hypothetical protein
MYIIIIIIIKLVVSLSGRENMDWTEMNWNGLNWTQDTVQWTSRPHKEKIQSDGWKFKNSQNTIMIHNIS